MTTSDEFLKQRKLDPKDYVVERDTSSGEVTKISSKPQKFISERGRKVETPQSKYHRPHKTAEYSSKVYAFKSGKLAAEYDYELVSRDYGSFARNVKYQVHRGGQVETGSSAPTQGYDFERKQQAREQLIKKQQDRAKQIEWINRGQRRQQAMDSARLTEYNKQSIQSQTRRLEEMTKKRSVFMPEKVQPVSYYQATRPKSKYELRLERLDRLNIEGKQRLESLYGFVKIKADPSKSPWRPVEIGKTILRMPFEQGAGIAKAGSGIALSADVLIHGKGRRKQLIISAKKVPKIVASSYNPKTPEGVINIGFTALAVKGVGSSVRRTKTASQRGTVIESVTAQKEIGSTIFETQKGIAEVKAGGKTYKIKIDASAKGVKVGKKIHVTQEAILKLGKKEIKISSKGIDTPTEGFRVSKLYSQKKPISKSDVYYFKDIGKERTIGTKLSGKGTSKLSKLKKTDVGVSRAEVILQKGDVKIIKGDAFYIGGKKVISKFDKRYSYQKTEIPSARKIALRGIESTQGKPMVSKPLSSKIPSAREIALRRYETTLSKPLSSKIPSARKIALRGIESTPSKPMISKPLSSKIPSAREIALRRYETTPSKPMISKPLSSKIPSARKIALRGIESTQGKPMISKPLSSKIPSARKMALRNIRTSGQQTTTYKSIPTRTLVKGLEGQVLSASKVLIKQSKIPASSSIISLTATKIKKETIQPIKKQVPTQRYMAASKQSLKSISKQKSMIGQKQKPRTKTIQSSFTSQIPKSRTALKSSFSFAQESIIKQTQMQQQDKITRQQTALKSTTPPTMSTPPFVPPEIPIPKPVFVVSPGFRRKPKTGTKQNIFKPIKLKTMTKTFPTLHAVVGGIKEKKKKKKKGKKKRLFTGLEQRGI